MGNDTAHMEKLQQLLLRQDQAILGVINTDDKDLAKSATVKASSETVDGKATNVLDGFNREINDGKTHKWCGDMNNGEQWIELSWAKPVKMNTVQLTFDTGLERFLRLSGQDWVNDEQVRGPQPETVSNYTIEALMSDGKKIVAEGEYNFLRRVEHRFDTLEVNAIKLIIQKTHGDPLAKVFEMRCYLE